MSVAVYVVVVEWMEKKARKKRVITKKFVIIHHHREPEGTGEKRKTVNCMHGNQKSYIKQ